MYVNIVGMSTVEVAYCVSCSGSIVDVAGACSRYKVNSVVLHYPLCGRTYFCPGDSNGGERGIGLSKVMNGRAGGNHIKDDVVYITSIIVGSS